MLTVFALEGLLGCAWPPSPSGFRAPAWARTVALGEARRMENTLGAPKNLQERSGVHLQRGNADDGGGGVVDVVVVS